MHDAEYSGEQEKLNIYCIFNNVYIFALTYFAQILYKIEYIYCTFNSKFLISA